MSDITYTQYQKLLDERHARLHSMLTDGLVFADERSEGHAVDFWQRVERARVSPGFYDHLVAELFVIKGPRMSGKSQFVKRVASQFNGQVLTVPFTVSAGAAKSFKSVEHGLGNPCIISITEPWVTRWGRLKLPQAREIFNAVHRLSTMTVLLECPRDPFTMPDHLAKIAKVIELKAREV